MVDNFKYWLALGRIKGVERMPVHDVVTALGGVDRLFNGNLRAVAQYSPELAAGIKEFDGWDLIEREQEKIRREAVGGAGVTDAKYPALLREINDPPPFIYFKGAATDVFNSPCVAIIGTRRPSHYGLRMSERIAFELASSGVSVVSGMARGCDTAAHKGALKAGGATVAVIGTGIDVVYPSENKKLSDEVVEKGLLISEYLMGTPPLPYNFPRRNRLIAGLVRAVVVVEAPLRSGALQTARLALEYGRDVFAVPGAVSSPKSAGTNRLIKDGAGLVETGDDILNALNIPKVDLSDGAPSTRVPELNGAEKSIWGALSLDEAVHIDAIAAKSGLSVAKTSSLLFEMELKGIVRQRPGMCFIRGC